MSKLNSGRREEFLIDVANAQPSQPKVIKLTVRTLYTILCYSNESFRSIVESADDPFLRECKMVENLEFLLDPHGVRPVSIILHVMPSFLDTSWKSCSSCLTQSVPETLCFTPIRMGPQHGQDPFQLSVETIRSFFCACPSFFSLQS